MQRTTKQRILDAAIRCFNRSGIAGTRLQHIADEAEGMSVGNMAYHYRTKELIVQAIWEQLRQEQEGLMAEFRVLPLFEDLERQMRSQFQIQQRYRFFYQDTLDVLRSYPAIAALHRRHWAWQEQQLRLMFRFNVSRGAFAPEQAEGQHDRLAALYWAQAETWLYRQELLGLDAGSFAGFRDPLWGLLSSCFSDMGWLEFRQLNALIAENYV
ncbi:MAG: TetR/AcrR family transcriptional regulator [Bacteroidia bacterium]|nr:TetR/AcrR family transcriptional regulator [Bacteroidia bacterium]